MNELQMQDRLNIDEATIEQIIETVPLEFENMVAISVGHPPNASDDARLDIKIHTKEITTPEQHLDAFWSGGPAIVDIGDRESLRLPYSVSATFDGPGIVNGEGGTTIYMGDNIKNMETRSLREGINRLEQKLAGQCPTCEEHVEHFNSHYLESPRCREDERLYVDSVSR